MLILISVTGVNAATNATLPDIAYSKFAKYGMTTSHKLKVQRYLSAYPVTDSEADALVAKADAAVAVMEKAGTTNYAKLTKAQKEEIKVIANEAAAIVKVTLVFGDKEVKIYKNGKFIDVISFETGKLVYTGKYDLADIAYTKFAKYGMTTAHKAKVQRFFEQYEVSDSDAELLIAKADAAVAVMEKAGTTNYAKLTKAQKEEIKVIANEAAAILKLTLAFDDTQVKIYKNGKFLDVVSFETGKLAYTGNNSMILVVSSIAIIALTSIVVTRKKLANA